MRISDWSSDVCSSDLTSRLKGCAAAIASNTPARLAKRRRIEGPCSLAAAISALHQLHASFIPAGDEADACGQGQVDGCSHHNDLHRPARLVERRAHEEIPQTRENGSESGRERGGPDV